MGGLLDKSVVRVAEGNPTQKAKFLKTGNTCTTTHRKINTYTNYTVHLANEERAEYGIEFIIL